MGSEPFEVGYFERLAEFVKGLGVQLKKKKGVKDDTKIFNLSNRKEEVATYRAREDFCNRKIRSLFLYMLSLRCLSDIKVDMHE